MILRTPWSTEEMKSKRRKREKRTQKGRAAAKAKNENEKLKNLSQSPIVCLIALFRDRDIPRVIYTPQIH